MKAPVTQPSGAVLRLRGGGAGVGGEGRGLMCFEVREQIKAEKRKWGSISSNLAGGDFTYFSSSFSCGEAAAAAHICTTLCDIDKSFGLYVCSLPRELGALCSLPFVSVLLETSDDTTQCNGPHLKSLQTNPRRRGHFISN